MKKLLFLGVFICTGLPVLAEFRIWENRAGDIWEAEFITMNIDKVRLRNQGGEEKEYRLTDLSAADVDYLDERLPPKLSIDISKTTDGTGSGATMKVICNATIKQSDTRGYDGELTLVLLVIGEDKRTGSYSTVSRTEENFTLPEEWGKVVEVSSRASTVYKSDKKRGRVYSGYVAVVWDRFGNAIAVVTNKPALEERAQKMAYVSLKNRKKFKR